MLFNREGRMNLTKRDLFYITGIIAAPPNRLNSQREPTTTSIEEENQNSARF